MSGIWVVLAYGVALALALFLLYWYGSMAWYWHVLSAAVALGLGLVPPPVAWQGPTFDLMLGSVFILLIVWGVGGVLIHGTGHHHPRQKPA
jgi:hypothetical protein